MAWLFFLTLAALPLAFFFRVCPCCPPCGSKACLARPSHFTLTMTGWSNPGGDPCDCTGINGTFIRNDNWLGSAGTEGCSRDTAPGILCSGGGGFPGPGGSKVYAVGVIGRDLVGHFLQASFNHTTHGLWVWEYQIDMEVPPGQIDCIGVGGPHTLTYAPSESTPGPYCAHDGSTVEVTIG